VPPQSMINVMWRWKTTENWKAHFWSCSRLWGLFSQYSVPHWISLKEEEQNQNTLGYLRQFEFGKKNPFLNTGFYYTVRADPWCSPSTGGEFHPFKEMAALNRKLWLDVLLSLNQVDNGRQTVLCSIRGW